MDDGLEMAVDLDRTRVEREVASTSSTVQDASARLAEPRRHAQVAKQIVLARSAEDAPDMLDMRSQRGVEARAAATDVDRRRHGIAMRKLARSFWERAPPSGRLARP